MNFKIESFRPVSHCHVPFGSYSASEWALGWTLSHTIRTGIPSRFLWWRDVQAINPIAYSGDLIDVPFIEPFDVCPLYLIRQTSSEALRE